MIKRVDIIFYRGSGFMSSLIRFFTWGKYSHVALRFENGDLWESYPGKGVRCGQESSATNPETYTLWVSDVSEDLLRGFLRQQRGKGYDYFGVLRFIPRIGRYVGTPKRWFCSELVFEALYFAGVRVLNHIRGNKVSPASLSLSPRFI